MPSTVSPGSENLAGAGGGPEDLETLSCYKMHTSMEEEVLLVVEKCVTAASKVILAPE